MNEDGLPTVREVILEAAPDLVLLTDDDGLDRRVRGVMVSDIEDPTPWMAGGTLLMTNGPAFADSVAAGIRLLHRLRAVETVALGVGVGLYVEHVHPDMVTAAKALGIPLFEVPYHIPFRSIGAYVSDALTSSDLHRLRRTLAIESRLLDLVLEDRTVEEIVEQLSAVLEVGVILFDARGRCLHQAWGHSRSFSDAEEVWAMVQQQLTVGHPSGALQLHDLLLFFGQIALGGVLERVLVAATDQIVDSVFIEAAVSSASKVVALRLVRDSEREAVERRAQAVLLEDLLAGHGSNEELTYRLREHGIVLERGFRIFVTDLASTLEPPRRLSDKELFEARSRALRAIPVFFTGHGESSLGLFKGRRIVSLATAAGSQDASDVREVLLSLRMAVSSQWGEAVSIGASSRGFSISEVARAYRQAIEAVRMATSGTSRGSMACAFDEMNEPLALLAGEGDETLHAVAERYLGPLQRHDEARHGQLVRTLSMFFTHGMSLQRTAAALFLHRNSLQMRLRRIEELLDIDLRRVDDVVQVYLALRAHELLSSRDATRDP